MIKAIGFNQGQIGDLAINMIAVKAFKKQYPDSSLIFGINKKYRSVSPVFYQHPMIDGIHLWDAYDNWPSDIDKKFIIDGQFDIVFNAMPQHKNQQWFASMHHTQAICLNHDLEPPDDLQIELTRWFDTYLEYKDYVALTCFSSAGSIRDIPADFANQIIEYIHSLGLKTIQLGLSSHPLLKTTLPPIGKDIFEDVKIAKSCRFLLTTDTGMNWILSGYKSKVLGLYSSMTYANMAPLYNRVPVNPNAIYLENQRITDIPFATIQKSIDRLLYA